MFKQTEEYYKNQKLGFGDGSIYDYGCFLVSLVNGLVDFGHDFTPKTFNEFLKDKKLWTGPYLNYIDVNSLATKLPDIFTSFKRIDDWPGFSTVEWYLSRDYVVLGKVSAKGIGGSGSHFVRIIGTNNSTMTEIQDPWFGTTDPVTKHYGNYGNILGLRVFGVKNYQNSMSDKKYTEEEMTKVREERDENWNKYQEEKRRNEAIIEELKTKESALSDSRNQLLACKNTVTNFKDEDQRFIDKVAKKIGSPADKTNILEALDINAAQAEEMRKKATQLEKKYSLLEFEKKEEIDSLEKRLEAIKAENEELRTQLDKTDKVLKRLEVEIEKLKEQKEQITRANKIIEAIINFFKRK